MSSVVPQDCMHQHVEKPSPCTVSSCPTAAAEIALITPCVQGSGRQQKGAIINLVAFYVFAMPLALFLAFYAGWGVLGLFAGMGLGPIIQTLLYGWLVLRTGTLLAQRVITVPMVYMIVAVTPQLQC